VKRKHVRRSAGNVSGAPAKLPTWNKLVLAASFLFTVSASHGI